MKRQALALLLILVLLAANAPLASANFHNTFINIFDKTKDSVASITVTVARQVLPGVDKSEGAGFVWTSDGYIISAAHIFRGNVKEIEVVVDGRPYKARLAGKDDKTDIALLKIDGAPPLKTIPFGDSDAIQIGEWVVAIGDPFGLDHTMTHGIISGKKRDLGIFDEFIQHDAAINPGNSGGPLVNIKNEIIGMNTVVANGNNTGFAVPINLIKKISSALKISGKVARSWLGVEIEDLKNIDSQKLALLNPTYKTKLGENVLVVIKVAASSPAEKAGVKTGDIIRLYDGQKIKNSLDFARSIGYRPPGEIIYLTIERQNKNTVIAVKLAPYPEKN